MSIIVKPYTWSAGQTIVASEHNSNFDTLYNLVNGGLDTSNISPSALIALSQISFSTAVTMTGVWTQSGAIMKWSKGADVASSAGTITLGDDGNFFDITGTSAITSITAKSAGTIVFLQFDSTASLVDGSNLILNGNFSGAAESTITLISDGTNWYEVGRSPVSFTPTASNALSGSVIQTVYTESGAVSTGTTTMPADDTIPQITEGDEYMTRSITPNNASNTLEITVVFNGDLSGATAWVVGLFQDSTANALAGIVVSGDNVSAGMQNSSFIHTMTSGTTSSTTFRVRAGRGSGSDTLTFNGSASGRLLGGVMASSITIREIKA